MSIEEGVGFYELIASVGGWGIAGIIILVWVAGSVPFVFQKSKRPITTRTIALAVAAFILIAISLLFLKVDANRRQGLIRLANNVKSEFIVNGFKSMTYRMIWEFNPALHDSTEASASEAQEALKSKLASLPTIFPTEFAHAVTDGLDDTDTLGLQLIDPAALAKIDAFNNNNLGLIKATIQDYMIRTGKTEMSFRDIRDNIDMFYDDEWIELMASRYDSVFVPITRIDKKASRKQMWSQYSDNHLIRLKKKGK